MKLGIGFKLYGGFGLVVLSLILIGVVRLTQVTQLGDKAKRSGDTTPPTEFLVWRTHFNMVQLRDQVPIFVHAAEDKRDEHLARMSEQEQAIAADFQDLRAQPILDVGTLALLTDAEQKLDAWYAARDAGPMSLARADNAGAADEALHGASAGLYEAADEAIVTFHKGFRAIVNVEAEAAVDAVDRANLLIAVVMVVAVAAAAVVAFLLARSISGRVREMSAALVDLAENVIPQLTGVTQAVGRGDLSQTADIRVEKLTANSSDEIGDKARSFNATVEELDGMSSAVNEMVGSLHGIVGQVGRTASSLSVASSEMASAATEAGDATSGIASSSQQMATGADEQAQSVAQTRSVVNDLAGSIDRISSGSDQQVTSISNKWPAPSPRWPRRPRGRLPERSKRPGRPKPVQTRLMRRLRAWPRSATPLTSRPRRSPN